VGVDEGEGGEVAPVNEEKKEEEKERGNPEQKRRQEEGVGRTSDAGPTTESQKKEGMGLPALSPVQEKATRGTG